MEKAHHTRVLGPECVEVEKVRQRSVRTEMEDLPPMDEIMGVAVKLKAGKAGGNLSGWLASNNPDITWYDAMYAEECFEERETWLGVHVHCKCIRSQSVNREVQYNVRGVADGFIALLYTGARVADHGPSGCAPPTGSCGRLHGSQNRNRCMCVHMHF